MSPTGRRFAGIGDVPLLALSLLLTGIGVAMIFSAGQVDVPSAATGAWQKQLLWCALALGVFLAVDRVPMRWIEWVTPWAYGAALLALVAVLLVGSGPNTRSWFALGPVKIQPAEFAKLATILMLARTLSGYQSPPDRLVQLFRPLVVVGVPFLLVAAQPDLGSAIIFGVILIAGLFWAGVPLRTIVLLVSPGISLILGFSAVVWGLWFLALVGFLWWERSFMAETVAVVLANIAAGAMLRPLWNSLAEYQQKRLLVFLNPGIDPRGAGWHLIQSKVAIGSGGLLGQGFGQGPQKRLAFLPEQHTDFIFSVVGEELGFLGVVVILALLAWLLLRVLEVARTSPDDFGGTVVFSLFGVWFAHLLINVGMTVGLMPITGLPLPFLSYGGSFLLSLFVGLALVQRVAAEA